MTKEEAIQKLREEGQSAFSWVMNLAILFLIISILSPVLLLWATLITFIKVLFTALFLFVVCTLAWRLLKKLIKEISEEQAENFISKRKTFQERMNEKMKRYKQ